MVVRGVLGVADLASLFESARVGDIHRDGRHSTFRVVLPDGVDVGSATKVGAIAIGNANGKVRVTLPWAWRGVLTALVADCCRSSVDENGRQIAVCELDAVPGRGPDIPLPLGSDLRLAITVARRG